MADDTRERLHQATLACAGRSAFRFSVEEVAAEAGVSRATVYRHFPGGKEQLIADGVAWEVDRFFADLSLDVEGAPDLTRKVEVALLEGRRRLQGHVVLRQILSEDPDQLLATLEPSVEAISVGIHTYLVSLLENEELAEGIHVDEAAEYLARLFLSYLGHAGPWDLDDPAELHRLVRTQFVGGILASP